MLPTIDVIFPISDNWLVPYLRNACRSIIAQHYPQELIKIYISWYFEKADDDVSEVAKLAREVEAVLLFNKWTDPAFAIGKAYNLAARCGSREVIGCFDSDVVFHPHTFKIAAKYLIEGRSAVVPVGRSTLEPGSSLTIQNFINGNAAFDNLPSTRDGIGNILIPRFLFEKLRGFDERMYGWGGIDTDLYYRVNRTIKSVYLQDHGCHKAIHQHHPKTKTCESKFTKRNRHILATSTTLVRNEESWGGMNDVHVIDDEIKKDWVTDMNQPYNRTFLGVKAQHSELTYEVIDDIIKDSKIKRIIELGTAGGALSFYLGLCGKKLDIPVYTVDAVLPPDDTRRMFSELGVFYFKLNVMEPDGIIAVNSLIADEPVYLFCDNGNKAEEFTKYAPSLLPGSIISVHDWMYEVFPQQIGHIALDLKLEPYKEKIWDKNNLRMATWKVTDRGQKPVDYFGTSTKWRRGDESSWHILSVGGNFEAMGAAQLRILKRNGLKPDGKLLDVGCGSLRLGVQAIKYLNPKCYFGIDCDQDMVNAGLERELPPQVRQEKQPSFTINKYFDFSEFGNEKFDFAIAQSVFTHLPPTGIELCLKNVMERINPGGKFFASYNLADNHITRFGHKYPAMTRYSVEYFETLARKYSVGFKNIGHWGIEQNRSNDQLLLSFKK